MRQLLAAALRAKADTQMTDDAIKEYNAAADQHALKNSQKEGATQRFGRGEPPISIRRAF